jgi:Trk K+ transport system NAD-binding subunit
VAAIRRLSGVIIPEPQTTLKEKDVLMAVVKVASLKKIKAKFGI